MQIDTIVLVVLGVVILGLIIVVARHVRQTGELGIGALLAIVSIFLVVILALPELFDEPGPVIIVTPRITQDIATSTIIVMPAIESPDTSMAAATALSTESGNGSIPSPLPAATFTSVPMTATTAAGDSSQAATEKLENTPAVPSPAMLGELEILEPADGAFVLQTIKIRGSGAQVFPPDKYLNVIVISPSKELIEQYWPQKAPTIDDEGSWVSFPAFIGRPGPDDVGKTFKICALPMTIDLSDREEVARSELPASLSPCVSVTRS